MTKSQISTAESQTTDDVSEGPTTQGVDSRVPYDRFAQVVTERNAARDERQKLADRLDALERADLVKQEDYKTLAEKAQEAEATAKANAVASSRELLRVRVGAQIGLPVALAERLQGNTFEEMLEDAKRLQELLPSTQPPAAPTDAGQPSTQPPSLTLDRNQQRMLSTFNQYLSDEDKLTPEQYLEFSNGWNPNKPVERDDAS